MEEAVRRRFEKIEAILQEVAERQLAAEMREQARANRADARMDRMDARMDRMDARTDEMDARFEKRMRGFEKLVKIGMQQLTRLGARLDQYSKETDHKINALIDSQLRTEASLRALIASQRGRNGRNGRNN